MENYPNTPRYIAKDCLLFKGDRPCEIHKKHGKLCPCESYQPLQESMLLIKLDAVGDVLRTTCLLPAIKHRWPGIRITWLTRDNALPLLLNNPYLFEVIPYGHEGWLHLTTQHFTRVINLDAGKISAGLAAMAQSDEKIGYLLHADGYVTATNEAAEDWLRLGLFDDFKKANQRTYQHWMCEILDLPTEGLWYVLELTEDEKKEGQRHLQQLGLDVSRRIIAIHTGAGERWPQKQWGERKLIQLINELLSDIGGNYQLLLFGGPSERALNSHIIQSSVGQVIDAGCDNSVRHFAAMVGHCSVMLSGDSLAMHVALATGCRTVVLFGPTSHEEIELFGLGEKVIPDMDCLCCYKTACEKKPNCMDMISVEMVKEAIKRQLTKLG